MCIILYNETGKPYDHEKLSIAYDNNPHGMGIMWVEDGQIQTIRGLFSKAKMFSILEHFEGVPHAIHLRWRTRGKIVKEACHPFRASHKGSEKDVFMMHNGTFYGMTIPAGESDTQQFARKMRKITAEYGTDVLFNETFIRSVEKDIMSYNKVIFLQSDGQVSILNPSEWTVIDGIWMSNTYSFKKNYRKGTVTESISTRIATKLTTTGAKASKINGEAADDWYAKSLAWEKSRSSVAAKGTGVLTQGELEELTHKTNEVLSKNKQSRRERREARRAKETAPSTTKLLPASTEEPASAQPASVYGTPSPFTRDLEGRVVRRRRLPSGTKEVVSLKPTLSESDLTSEELAKMEAETKPTPSYYEYSTWMGYEDYDFDKAKEASRAAFGKPAMPEGHDSLEAAFRAIDADKERFAKPKDSIDD